MKSRRPYAMQRRAAAAEATRRRVLDAAVALLRTGFRSDIRLDDIAARAEVTVQTVLRLYGSRTALLDLAITDLLAHIGSQTLQAAPGDITGSITALFDHYEEAGDLVIRSLAEEASPGMQQLIEVGRSAHRWWVQTQFAPQLARCDDVTRAWLEDALVCVCDVYTWKRLRRDMGRSRARAEAIMTSMITALVAGA